MDSRRVYSLLLICVLAAVGGVACVPSNEPVSPPTIVPSEPPPTATILPTATATTEPTETPTPTLTPAPDIPALAEACDGATLIYTSGHYFMDKDPEYSISTVCPDTGEVHRLFTSADFYLSSIAASPDGDRIVVSAFGEPGDGLRYLYEFDMVGGVLELLLSTEENGDFFPTWSHDGEYIAYRNGRAKASPDGMSYALLEILHLESGVVSVIDIPYLSDFEWSPVDNSIYLGTMVPDTGIIEEYISYLAKLACDETSHQCELTEQVEWSNVGSRRASWLPDGSGLVSSSLPDQNQILLTDISGQLIDTISLEDIGLGYSSNVSAYRPKVSKDGRYIAFRVGFDLIVIDLYNNNQGTHLINSHLTNDEVISYSWLE